MNFFGSPANTLRFTRTVVLVRRCAIRFAPMLAVGNDSSASRVDSMVDAASTYIALAPTTGAESDRGVPFTYRSRPVTFPPLLRIRVTCARGSSINLRRESSFSVQRRPMSSRIASMSSVALEYLLKPNSPDSGPWPWTARGASFTSYCGSASPNAPSSSSRSTPEM